MSLRSRGFDVTIVEKNCDIGGRNTPIEVGSCKFDVGPTMLQFKVSGGGVVVKKKKG
jgi:phytoene desaturase